MHYLSYELSVAFQFDCVENAFDLNLRMKLKRIYVLCIEARNCAFVIQTKAFAVGLG